MTGRTGSRGAALREITALVGSVLGGDPTEHIVAAARRGPLHVAVQELVVAVVLTGLFAIKVGVLGDAFALPAAAFAALWLALPPAVHWFVEPPVRAAGLALGAAMGAMVGAVVVGLGPLPGPWNGFAAVTLGFLAGAATFGAAAVDVTRRHALWAAPIGTSLLALLLWPALGRLDLAVPVAAAGCLGVLAVSAIVRRGPRPARDPVSG